MSGISLCPLIIISCVLIFEIAQFVTDNKPPRRGRLESEFDNGTVQNERGNKTALHSPKMEVECWSWNTGRIDFVWSYSYYYCPRCFNLPGDGHLMFMLRGFNWLSLIAFFSNDFVLLRTES